MKTKNKFNFFNYVFVVSLLLFSSHSYAQTIVGYTLTTNGTATSGIAVNYPSQGRVMNISGVTSMGYSVANGQTCYGFNSVGNDGWVTSAFSTAGYVNLSGSFQMKGNSTSGLRDVKIQYSIDGTNWYDTPTGSSITLTNALANYSFTLPSDCDNKTTVQIRWVQNSSYDLSGGVLGTTSSANASLKGVSIAGDAFAAPSTQASNISIISVTPTTIKVGCTNGNGNNRIIVINTTNSFTDPVNDYYPTANTSYGGSGQQVIYNGSGSSVTVTVPSSKDVFWFRVYDYNKMDNLTRYNVNTASINPKKCQLEDIHTPTSVNVRLVRVDLGATIKTPTTGTIVERGIFWSTSPNVDETANLVSESSTSGGTFVLSDIFVDRGTTIYYKGFVTNESGTIMSEEASFTNVPIFTGTGNWETAARWNVQEVPGANGEMDFGSVEDSPIINGICTLTANNNVTNLTINSSRKLTINKGVTMRVDGTLTNNGGINGLLIKSIDDASDASPNGSLIFADGTPQATVEMFSKAEFNTSNPEGSRYKWQFFGIPVTSASYISYFNNIAYVRAWDESVTSYWDAWVRENDGTPLQLGLSSTLTPGFAYEICQQNNRKYSFVGTLNTADFSKTLQYTPTAYFKGQNLLSNPYTASMDVRDMVFGSNTQAAVYLYNSGTYNDWLTANGEYEPGEGPGTYKVLTPGTAGSGGVDAEIAGMQGFIVKATAHPGSVSYAKSNLVPNTQKQRAKAVDTKMSTMIDLRGTKFSDRMWLFVDDNCTSGFDNGFDGPKMLAGTNISQLFGIGTDDNYQINVLDDINEAYIGIQKGEESSLKLTFNHSNLNEKYQTLYLVDLVTNQTIDITLSGSEYSFTTNDSDPVKRFKIIGNEWGTTSTNDISNNDLKLIIQDNKLIVDCKLNENGKLQIFDLAGKLQAVYNFNANVISTFVPNLSKGIYVAHLTAGLYDVSQRVIIK